MLLAAGWSLVGRWGGFGEASAASTLPTPIAVATSLPPFLPPRCFLLLCLPQLLSLLVVKLEVVVAVVKGGFPRSPTILGGDASASVLVRNMEDSVVSAALSSCFGSSSGMADLTFLDAPPFMVVESFGG